jgi:hypothetical protein
MARFGLKIALSWGLSAEDRCPDHAPACCASREGWWSRGENRFIPDYQSRFKDLAGPWLRVV